jgi:predicted RNase H-like HicB family nuclease
MAIVNGRRHIDRIGFAAVVRDERLVDGSVRYVAEHPDLPGCMSDGGTPEEALANLDDARRLYLETLLINGLPIPEPA